MRYGCTAAETSFEGKPSTKLELTKVETGSDYLHGSTVDEKLVPGSSIHNMLSRSLPFLRPQAVSSRSGKRGQRILDMGANMKKAVPLFVSLFVGVFLLSLCS